LGEEAIVMPYYARYAAGLQNAINVMLI